MQKWLLELEKFWRTLEKLPFNPSFLFFFWIPWTGICACLVMQEFRHAMPLSFQFFWCATREEKRKMIILTGSLCVKYLFRYIQSCSALAGQGLYEGLAWLANNIANKATWCKNMTLCETIILWHNSHCICIYIYNGGCFTGIAMQIFKCCSDREGLVINHSGESCYLWNCSTIFHFKKRGGSFVYLWMCWV